MTEVTARKLTAYFRLLYGLPGFLRTPITPRQARRMLEARLERRRANLIRILDGFVFQDPDNPYRALLRWAGIGREQITESIEKVGVEGTLRRLRQEGVYITFEEFKGRKAIERPGLHIPPSKTAFDNPHLRRHYAGRSSGSTGPGTRVRVDLEHLELQSPNYYLAREAQGLIGITAALWRPSLPATSGIGSILRGAKIDWIFDRWFVPALGAGIGPPPERLFFLYLQLAGMIARVPIPRQESLPMDQAEVVAEWGANAADRDGLAYISASTSMAVRVSRAALDLGASLEGVTFSAGGEPVTRAKASVIRSAGADLRPSYFMSETGAIGMHCGDPIEDNDQHLFTDCFALFPHDQTLPGSDRTVPSFILTSLLPSTPKIMLNVEVDDYGILEERECGCVLGQVGLKTHIRRIQSISKLTGEGMSLVGSDMVRVLHEVLPARFGGGPLDYQLEERESEGGLTELTLRVNPRLSIPDPKEVATVVYSALGQIDDGSRLASALWSEADVIQVERSEPVWTERGKLHPLISFRTSRRFHNEGEE